MSVLRVARRAIRQFYRENVFQKGLVITLEAQLAVIFGQRVVDKVRPKINVETPKSSRNPAALVLDLFGSLS